MGRDTRAWARGIRRLGGLAALAGVVAGQPSVQLDPLGTDGVRVRLAPPGVPIVEPPLQALLGTATASRRGDAPRRDGPLPVTNGNLQVTADAVSGELCVMWLQEG